GIRKRVEQLSVQPQRAVLQEEQHDEAERQREDIGQIEGGARSRHGGKIPVQHVQRDDEEGGERDQIDQEDQELLGAHQLERDDPEPEVDLEQKVRQPQRRITD